MTRMSSQHRIRPVIRTRVPLLPQTFILFLALIVALLLTSPLVIARRYLQSRMTLPQLTFLVTTTRR